MSQFAWRFSGASFTFLLGALGIGLASAWVLRNEFRESQQATLEGFAVLVAQIDEVSGTASDRIGELELKYLQLSSRLDALEALCVGLESRCHALESARGSTDAPAPARDLGALPEDRAFALSDLSSAQRIELNAMERNRLFLRDSSGRLASVRVARDGHDASEVDIEVRDTAERLLSAALSEAQYLDDYVDRAVVRGEYVVADTLSGANAMAAAFESARLRPIPDGIAVVDTRGCVNSAEYGALTIARESASRELTRLGVVSGVLVRDDAMRVLIQREQEEPR